MPLYLFSQHLMYACSVVLSLVIQNQYLLSYLPCICIFIQPTFMGHLVYTLHILIQWLLLDTLYTPV